MVTRVLCAEVCLVMKANHPATNAAERARDRASRVKACAEDCLLDKHEAAAFVCLGPDRFVVYARRWPALREGARVVRARPGSRGRLRWLKSALIRHIREELLRPDIELDSTAPLRTDPPPNSRSPRPKTRAT